MTQIIKRVNRVKPSVFRTQTFTQLDGGTGDIFMVKKSLGYPASSVSIEAIAAMTLRFNVVTNIIKRNYVPEAAVNYNPDLDGVDELLEYIDESGGLITLALGETYISSKEIPINDIQIVSADGDFDIFVS